MTREEVGTMLEKAGIPVEYYKFDEDSGIEPPFLVWYLPVSRGWYADDRRYVDICQLVIELYTDEKDFLLEDKIEKILEEHDFSCTTDEQYLQDELMFEKIYITEVILDAEQQHGEQSTVWTEETCVCDHH